MRPRLEIQNQTVRVKGMGVSFTISCTRIKSFQFSKYVEPYWERRRDGINIKSLDSEKTNWKSLNEKSTGWILIVLPWEKLFIFILLLFVELTCLRTNERTNKMFLSFSPSYKSCCMATLSSLPYHHALNKKSFVSIDKPQGGVAQDEFLWEASNGISLWILTITLRKRVERKEALLEPT